MHPMDSKRWDRVQSLFDEAIERPEPERDLFLIAKPQADKFVAEFVKFQAYQPPPEEFLSSIDYIEQLDLDGDGVGEVFATQGGFDGYALLVFRKVNGRWRQVHDMAGDAC